MVHLQQLRFSYTAKRPPLFDKLDMTLPAGTICGLLGANGAGKSTLLKIMAGLLFPAAGSCRVLDRTPALRQPELLSEIFLLPEDLHVPALSAIQFARRYAVFYPRFDHQQFRTLLQEFELDPRQRLNTLSQGQKKKFLLAFGIATNTRLLIMDEPTNGLDIPGKSQFRRILLQHCDEQRSFIISTHQVSDLDGLIDSVAIIAGGRILLHEALDDIAARYFMATESGPPQDALYYEQTLAGYAVVRDNIEGVDSRPNLALLFGMLTTQHSGKAQASHRKGV